MFQGSSRTIIVILTCTVELGVNPLCSFASIDNVHFQHAAQLIEALVNQNVQFGLQVRPLTMSCYNVITG